MKKWYQSKTLWTNAVGFVAMIATAIGVDGEVSAQILAAEGLILAIVNAVLRAITNTGLEK